MLQMTVCCQSFHLKKQLQPSSTSVTLTRMKKNVRRANINNRRNRKYQVNVRNLVHPLTKCLIHLIPRIWQVSIITYSRPAPPSDLMTCQTQNFLINVNSVYMFTFCSGGCLSFRETIRCPSPPPPQSPVQKQSRQVKQKLRWVWFLSFYSDLHLIELNKIKW